MNKSHVTKFGPHFSALSLEQAIYTILYNKKIHTYILSRAPILPIVSIAPKLVGNCDSKKAFDTLQKEVLIQQ